MKRLLLILILTLAACGGHDAIDDPIHVELGETTVVVLVNPIVNDANNASIAASGDERDGVLVEFADGPGGLTGPDGLIVLRGAPEGAQTLWVDGSPVELVLAAGELRELAVALTGSGAAVMADVPYPLNDVVEIDDSMPAGDIQDALAMSNTIVFLRGGNYHGDLAFTGSSVTLFGEGEHGGTVTIDGNVDVGGSSNRIRGAGITGDVVVNGSDFGLSFGAVDGALVIESSSGTVLNTIVCGGATVSGSDTRMLDNPGLAPISTDGC